MIGSTGPITRKLLSGPASETSTANGREAPSNRLEPKGTYYKRYRVLGVIGGGAFGEVYLAVQEQEHVSQYVAIKVLNIESQKPKDIVGLQREAQVMASLHHRLFPRMIDLIYFRQQWALVMEWIPGISLSRACRVAGRLPLSVALEVVAELANGVHTLHTRLGPFGGAAAHCDIKPGNIRISSFGCVRLMDLGSTRCFGTDWSASTHPYAAPELHSGFVNPAADVFSMGVTMLAILTRLPDHEITCTGDAERYRESHLQRFPYATDREVIALIQRMIDPSTEVRPSAFEVELACRRMRRWIDGPCLAEWAPCEVAAHAPSRAVEGALTGVEVTVEASPIVVETTVEDRRIPVLNQPFYAPLRSQE